MSMPEDSELYVVVEPERAAGVRHAMCVRAAKNRGDSARAPVRPGDRIKLWNPKRERYVVSSCSGVLPERVLPDGRVAFRCSHDGVPLPLVVGPYNFGTADSLHAVTVPCPKTHPKQEARPKITIPEWEWLPESAFGLPPVRPNLARPVAIATLGTIALVGAAYWLLGVLVP